MGSILILFLPRHSHFMMVCQAVLYPSTNTDHVFCNGCAHSCRSSPSFLLPFPIFTVVILMRSMTSMWVFLNYVLASLFTYLQPFLRNFRLTARLVALSLHNLDAHIYISISSRSSGSTASYLVWNTTTKFIVFFGGMESGQRKRDILYLQWVYNKVVNIFSTLIVLVMCNTFQHKVYYILEIVCEENIIFCHFLMSDVNRCE